MCVITYHVYKIRLTNWVLALLQYLYLVCTVKHFTVKYIFFWNQLAMVWPSMHGHHEPQRPEPKVTNLGGVKEDGHMVKNDT